MHPKRQTPLPRGYGPRAWSRFHCHQGGTHKDQNIHSGQAMPVSRGGQGTRCPEAPHQEGDADHQHPGAASLSWSLATAPHPSFTAFLHFPPEGRLSKINVYGGVGTWCQLINVTINNTSHVTMLIGDYQDVSNVTKINQYQLSVFWI